MRPSWWPVTAALKALISSSGRSPRPASAAPTADRTSLIIALLSWHIFENPAEVAEAHGGVHALGHPGRLQARGLASSGARVVDLGGGQRGAESAPPGSLYRSDVVDAAVVAEVVRQ